MRPLARTSMRPELQDILTDPSFADFFAAWQKARGGDDLPNRRDISMRDLAPFAEHMLLYEWDGGTNLHCRLMGASVTDRIKVNATSLNWLDAISHDMLAASIDWWNTVQKTPCAGAMEYSVAYLDGSCKIGQSLFLPVRRRSGDIHILALNAAYGTYQVEPSRDQIKLAGDCLLTSYIDVGFGAPNGSNVVTTHKSLPKHLQAASVETTLPSTPKTPAVAADRKTAEPEP